MNDWQFLVPVGDGTWTSATKTVTICNREYLLLFDRDGCNGPCLSLTPTTGSVVKVYVCTRDCCGPNYANFSIGDQEVCVGADGCGGGGGNRAVIKVGWVSCNWAGDAWYCARKCGTADAGRPIEILSEDAFDADIEILSGPFETETDAILACGPSPTPGHTCDAAPHIGLGQVISGKMVAGLPPLSTGNYHKFCLKVDPSTTYRIQWTRSLPFPNACIGCLANNFHGSLNTGACGEGSLAFFVAPPVGTATQPPACVTFTTGASDEWLCITVEDAQDDTDVDYTFVIKLGACP